MRELVPGGLGELEAATLPWPSFGVEGETGIFCLSMSGKVGPRAVPFKTTTTTIVNHNYASHCYHSGVCHAVHPWDGPSAVLK